jgi:hypothetical protein
MAITVRQMRIASQDDRIYRHAGATESHPVGRALTLSRPLPGPNGRSQTRRAAGRIPWVRNRECQKWAEAV